MISNIPGLKGKRSPSAGYFNKCNSKINSFTRKVCIVLACFWFRFLHWGSSNFPDTDSDTHSRFLFHSHCLPNFPFDVGTQESLQNAMGFQTYKAHNKNRNSKTRNIADSSFRLIEVFIKCRKEKLLFGISDETFFCITFLWVYRIWLSSHHEE